MASFEPPCRYYPFTTYIHHDHHHLHRQFHHRTILLSSPRRTVVSFHDEKFTVTVAKTRRHVDQWIQGIRYNYGHSPHKLFVGLDTEWRPNLAPGDDHPVATLQLSVGQSCLVFQILRCPWIPDSLRWFLENQDFTFCGVGIDDDVKKLYEHHGLRVSKTLDLYELFRECYKEEYWRIGLKRMCLRVLGKDMKKPKEVTLSAWDSQDLDDDQVEYAATDAFVSLRIALVLLRKLVSERSNYFYLCQII